MLKQECLRTAVLLHKLHTIMKTKREMRVAKMSLLQEMWRKEYSKLTTELAKSKDKHSRALLKRVAAISSDE